MPPGSDNSERIERVENAIMTLNREMGVVQTELKTIRWLALAILSAIIGGYFIP